MSEIELGKQEELEKVPSQEEVDENMKDAKVKAGEKETPKENVDYTNKLSVNDVIINFEKCKAIALDAIFDEKYLMYGLCATSLTGDGSNEKEQALRMNSVEELVGFLINDYDHYKDNIKFIDNIDDIDCIKELYTDEQVLEKSKFQRKIVVTFKDDQIDNVYAYKIPNAFVFRKTLYTINNTIQSNKNEMFMKNFIQNFMMNMSVMNQQRGKGGMSKTPGGILKP